MFDGTFPIFEMPPLLCIEHKFLTASLALVSSYPTMTESVGIVVAFVSVLVWAGQCTDNIFCCVSLNVW